MATPEVPALTDFENRILELCKSFPDGVPDKILQNDNPQITGDERRDSINNLIGLELIDLYMKNGEALFKLKPKKSVEENELMKNADKEERVVLEIIKDAGNKGIWIKDIRTKSNLNATHLNKIVKSLETKKLIKPVKSVAANRKKVYMLYNVEPHRSVTGGAWYSEQDFESEFVSILNDQCYKYLRERLDQSETHLEKLGPRAARFMALTKSEEVCQFIAKLGISKVELSTEDIECILDTLIYDGKVEKIYKGDNVYYVAVNSFIDAPGIVRTPCGVCPVFKDCTPHGIINPKGCQYYTKWLGEINDTEMSEDIGS